MGLANSRPFGTRLLPRLGCRCHAVDGEADGSHLSDNAHHTYLSAQHWGRAGSQLPWAWRSATAPGVATGAAQLAMRLAGVACFEPTRKTPLFVELVL